MKYGDLLSKSQFDRAINILLHVKIAFIFKIQNVKLFHQLAFPFNSHK